MTTESEHFQYFPIRNHPYDHWFREVQYNGKVLNTTERREFVKVVDETILDFSEGLPLLKETLDSIRDLHDEYKTLYAVNLFLSNAHTCFYNYFLTKYKLGELKEK